jgi:predicted PurR-regulated permease PerM
MLLFGSGALLFLVLLFQLRTILHPTILAGAGVMLLWPIRSHKMAHAMMLSGGFLLLVWFFVTLSGGLVPFLGVYLLAYLFDPVVTVLDLRFHVPRAISSFFVTLLIVSVVALLGLFLIPEVLTQLDSLGSHLNTNIDQFREWVLSSPLIGYAMPAEEERQAFVGRIGASLQTYSRTWTASIPSSVDEMVRSLGPLLHVAMIALLTPVMLFYMLKDYRRIKTGLVELFPLVGGQRVYLKRIGRIVGNYLRGQLTISTIGALFVTAGLVLAGVPFALLIGMMAGLLNMVPNLGPFITGVFGVFVALVFGERGLLDVVFVIAVLLGQSLLEQAVLVPRILSHHVGLHPVVILFSLFVFGALMGAIGLFVAVPAMALIAALYDTYRGRLVFDLSSYASSRSDAGDRVGENLFVETGVTQMPSVEQKDRSVLASVEVDLLER